MVRVRAFHPPGGHKPPEHYHPLQEERFEVVSGQMSARLDGHERTYPAGESFVVPPEAVHTMWNPGPEPTELIWETRPALKTGEFFERIWSAGRPSPVEFAVIARAYEDEFRLAAPPLPVRRVALGALAPLGRLRGHRP